MNNDLFRTFIVLAETKNFSVAAERLHVAQSTVSNRIKELEIDFGQKLFVRTNRSVELAAAGETFLPYAKRMMAIEEDLRYEMDTLKYTEILKIGTPHAVYTGHVKHVVKPFLKKNKDVSVKILIGHTPQLIELLSDGLIDAAIVSYLPKSFKTVELESFEDRVILIVNNSKQFKDTIEVDELSRIDLLNSDLGEAFEGWLYDVTKSRLSYSLYIDQINEVVDYVLDGLGYAFVPEALVKKHIEEKTVKRVKLSGVKPYILKHHFIMKSAGKRSDMIERFCAEL